MVRVNHVFIANPSGQHKELCRCGTHFQSFVMLRLVVRLRKSDTNR